jgi:hypothetical protein
MVGKDVCLLEFFNMVKENVQITTFNVNGNLSEVESMHMQATMINCVEIEFMQLVVIQVQVVAWKPHSQNSIC